MDRIEPIEFARHLRQTTNSFEQLLWQLLRNRQRCGKKFRRQHPLGIYTADFYCVEATLVVEVNGSPHETTEGKRKDAARDDWMRSQGIEVLRFGGWQVESDTQQVLLAIDEMLLEELRKMISNSAPHPEPFSPRSTGGEGSKVVQLTGGTARDLVHASQARPAGQARKTEMSPFPSPK